MTLSETKYFPWLLNMTIVKFLGRGVNELFIKSKKKIKRFWFGLVFLFIGISTFVDYLMPKSSL